MKKLQNQKAIDALNNPDHARWVQRFIQTHPETDIPLLLQKPIDYADTVDCSDIEHPELNYIEELSRLWGVYETDITQIPQPDQRLPYGDADVEATIGYKKLESLTLADRRNGHYRMNLEAEDKFTEEVYEYFNNNPFATRQQKTDAIAQIRKKWKNIVRDNMSDMLKNLELQWWQRKDQFTDEPVWIYCAVIVDPDGDAHYFNNSAALLAALVNFEKVIFHNSKYDATILIHHAVNLYTRNDNKHLFENTICDMWGYSEKPWEFIAQRSVPHSPFADKAKAEKHHRTVLRERYEDIEGLAEDDARVQRMYESYPELKEYREKKIRPPHLTYISSFHAYMAELHEKGINFNTRALFVPYQDSGVRKTSVELPDGKSVRIRRPLLTVNGAPPFVDFVYTHGGTRTVSDSQGRKRNKKFNTLRTKVLDSKKLISSSVKNMGEDFEKLQKAKVSAGQMKAEDMVSFKKGGEKGTATPLMYDLRDWLEKSDTYQRDVWQYCEQDVRIVTRWLDEKIEIDSNHTFSFREAIEAGYTSAALMAVSSINSIHEQVKTLLDSITDSETGEVDLEKQKKLFERDSQGRMRLRNLNFELPKTPMIDQPYPVTSKVWRTRYFEDHPGAYEILNDEKLPEPFETDLKKYQREYKVARDPYVKEQLEQKIVETYKEGFRRRKILKARIEKSIFVYCMEYAALGFSGGYSNNFFENTLKPLRKKKGETDTEYVKRASELGGNPPILKRGLTTVIDATSMYPTNGQTYQLPGAVIDRERPSFITATHPARAALREYANVGRKQRHLAIFQVRVKATLSSQAVRSFKSSTRLQNYSVQHKNRGIKVMDQYSRDIDATFYMTDVQARILWDSTNNGKNVEVFDVVDCMDFEVDQALMLAYEEFVSYWGSIKNRGALTGNPVLKMIGKLFLNAEYGKHANFQKRYLGRDVMTDEDISHIGGMKYANIHRAAYITAYARMRLTRLMKQLGVKNINGGDTDSVHYVLPDSLAQQCFEENSLKPLVDHLSQFIKVKNDFGGWTIDDVAEMTIYPRSKTYLLALLEYDENANRAAGRDPYYFSGRVARGKDGRRLWKARSAGYNLSADSMSEKYFVDTYLRAGFDDNRVVLKKQHVAWGGAVIREVLTKF